MHCNVETDSLDHAQDVLDKLKRNEVGQDNDNYLITVITTYDNNQPLTATFRSTLSHIQPPPTKTI